MHVVAHEIIESVYPFGGPVQNVAYVFGAQVQFMLAEGSIFAIG